MNYKDIYLRYYKLEEILGSEILERKDKKKLIA